MADEAATILPAESYPMVGGDGDHSYAKNSSYQRAVLDVVKEMINEAIADKLDLKTLGFDTSNINTFRVADLGCSVGPNTFIAVQNIIESVELKCRRNSSALEFQVFFNDHIENDFNTLFNTLPPFRKYWASGIPGSFHGRLFPKSTLHFVHSSYAVHWLSKIPKEIVDSKSPAWNKGNIQCTGFVKEVAEAYSTQFKKDMESFLNARVQELVPGGLMAIVLSGLPDGIRNSETAEGKFYDFLGSCLADMAKMGLLDEEKVDSFNLPLYTPTSKELQVIIERNECFTIEKMDILKNPMRNMKFHPQSGIRQLRAVLEGVIKAHFGSEFVDQIFNYIATKIPESLFAIKENKQHSKVILFVLLKRIID
ncbi:S-adenosylmethionine-dependent methyltransferase [Melia azedarach]|uniref:S-adenosylmethionine-dependent methyltransferase n=1 Tax=Melia azedarach TaxID=155640 RepID=A0ACC1X6J2_MELAZ|nr:S-adenosylmethionine-dependent methyltransferase [Melia azedarach]